MTRPRKPPAGGRTGLSLNLGEDALLTDVDVEVAAIGPLTLVLSAEAGRRVREAGLEGRMLVASVSGTHLFTAAVALVDTGLAVHLQVEAPADALLEHLRGTGRLLPPGTRPAPRTLRRRILAEVAPGDVPGSPIERMEARCDDRGGTCALARWTRRPGTPPPAWEPERAAPLPAREFDALWEVAMEAALFVTLASGPRSPAPARRLHFAVEAERMDGTVVANEQAWSVPSPEDRRVAPFFAAAEALARRIVPNGSKG